MFAQLDARAAVTSANGIARVLGQTELLQLERQHLFLAVILGRRVQNHVQSCYHGLDVAQLCAMDGRFGILIAAWIKSVRDARRDGNNSRAGWVDERTEIEAASVGQLVDLFPL